MSMSIHIHSPEDATTLFHIRLLYERAWCKVTISVYYSYIDDIAINVICFNML